MDSLYTSTSPGQMFYKAEVMKTGCVMEKHNNLVFDPRYTDSGLNTDQWELQTQSNVYDHLMTQPSFFGIGPKQGNLQGYKVKSWNRPTLSWSLQCEVEGKSRTEGYTSAMTDLARYEKIYTYRRVGIAMLISFLILTTLKCWNVFMHTQEEDS